MSGDLWTTVLAGTKVNALGTANVEGELSQRHTSPNILVELDTANNASGYEA